MDETTSGSSRAKNRRNQKANWIYKSSRYGLFLKGTDRPWFSTNPTFENPLKNPTSCLVEAGF